MIGNLLGPIASLAGTWLEGHVATKKAKTEAKIVTIKSEAIIKERQATGEIDWDIEQAKASALPNRAPFASRQCSSKTRRGHGTGLIFFYVVGWLDAA